MKTFTVRSTHCADLQLVAPTIDMADTYQKMCSDPQIQCWTTVPDGYTVQMARDFLNHTVPHAWENEAPIWAIVLRNHVVGNLSFNHSLQPGGLGEIGFYTHPDFRGQDIMTHAVHTALDWGFDDYGLGAISWTCEIHDEQINIGSAKVAWKCGFTFDGRLRKRLYNKGRLYDALTATILPHEPRYPTTTWCELKL